MENNDTTSSSNPTDELRGAAEALAAAAARLTAAAATVQNAAPTVGEALRRNPLLDEAFAEPARAAKTVSGQEMRNNPLLDEAFGEPARAAKTVSGQEMRNNPLLDEAFGETPRPSSSPATSPASTPAKPASSSTSMVPWNRGSIAKTISSPQGEGKLIENATAESGLARVGGGAAAKGTAGAAAGAAEGAGTAQMIAKALQFVPGPVGAIAKAAGPLIGALGAAAASGGGGGKGGTPAQAGNEQTGDDLTGPGASGLGELAKKVSGAIPVFGEVAKKLFEFGKAVVDAARAQDNLNRKYADASAAMAAVVAEADMRTLQREREIGDKTAGTAADLSESQANFDDNMGKIEALFSNVKNEVLSKLLDGINVIFEPVAEVFDAIRELLFEQSESIGAAKWLDDVRAEAERRKQAGDDWFRVRRGRD